MSCSALRPEVVWLCVSVCNLNGARTRIGTRKRRNLEILETHNNKKHPPRCRSSPMADATTWAPEMRPVRVRARPRCVAGVCSIVVCWRASAKNRDIYNIRDTYTHTKRANHISTEQQAAHRPHERSAGHSPMLHTHTHTLTHTPIRIIRSHASIGSQRSRKRCTNAHACKSRSQRQVFSLSSALTVSVDSPALVRVSRGQRAAGRLLWRGQTWRRGGRR